MMKATIKSDGAQTTVVVEGQIAGPWVGELERAWNDLRPSEGSRTITIELKDVTFIDDTGKLLLRRMAGEGATLRGAGCFTAAILNSILPSNDAPASGTFPKRSKAPKRRAGKFSVILMMSVLFATWPLRAQEKAALKLTLRDAVEMAVKQNPEVQIAALNLAESQKDSAIAFSALLPQADFNVSDRAVRTNLRANLGFSVPGFPDHAGPFQVFQTGSTFSSPILDLSLWRGWQASRKNITSTDEQRVSVREQVVLLVVSQYLSSLRANAEVEAGQSRVNLAQALYDQSADMEKHGAATNVDTLRANVELQNEKQRLIEAQTNEKIALYGLSKLLNLDPQQKIELDDAAGFSKTTDENLETDLAAAYKARPEMKALLAEQEARGYQRSATRDSRLPALRFDGSYEQQGLSSSTIIPTYVYQASVSLPLFTGGRIRAEMARDNLELKKIAQRITDERNQIALEVQTAAAQEESARNEVQVANLGVELAQQEVEQARDRFQAGVADNIEVTSAQDALARANDNQISALYRYNQARADLARATGQIETLYSK
ncbi:MAG TPA: TolC family protein [Candidatus Acidoferrales bacterium]|nr:TolC family protein [Candidatus Acidoferrales bacterium]